MEDALAKLKLAHVEIDNIVNEIKQKLEAVSVGALRGFGERLMTTSCPAVAAIGPVGRLESYKTFAGRFSHAAHAAE